MKLHIHDLGLIEYEKAWRLQDQLAGEIARGERPPTLLLLEHPHTYTFGRRGKAENLLWNEQARAEKGIAVHWVDRGGDVTYHGPGQLVGYPLIPLDNKKMDYVGYIRNLEKMLIIALAEMGLGAGQVKGLSGVWLQSDLASRCPRCKPEDRQKPAKIAAIGVKVDALGITRHGFALNVNPDMDFFDGIVPCGIGDHPVISMADVMPNPPAMETVKQKVSAAFSGIFGFEIALSKIDFLD